MSPDTPSRADIEAAYGRLCQQVGDLYFQLRHAEATFRGLQERMTKAEKERDQLHTALQSLPKEEPRVDAPAVDSSAG